MKESTHILIVEDKAADADLAKRVILKSLKNCEFQVVHTRKNFLQALQTFQPDVILSDYSLPQFDGMQALQLTLNDAPLTPFLIWTSSISEDVAVDFMKAGASNYVLKENPKRLGPAIVRALEEKELIVAHKRAEEALQNNERRFRALVQNGLASIALLTADGTLIWESPAITGTLNYAPNEHLGRNFFHELMHPDDLPWTQEIYARLVQEPGSSHHGICRLRHASGQWHWVEAIITNMLHEPGINAIVANYRDVNEHKQSEEALQNSEKRFRALIENGLDDISLLAADGTLLWESPSTIRNLGYKPGEYVGRNIFDLMHPDDLAWTSTAYVKLLHEPGGRQNGIFRLRRSDGSWRWVEAIVANMLNEPSVNALVINYRDITERKQTEERINDLLAFNEKILNHSPTGILTYKLTGECVFANQNAASIVGATVELLRAQNFNTIESWKKSGLYDLVMKAISTQEEVTADIRHISTFGKDVWMAACCVTFRSKEETHVLLALSDITERKEAEERLRLSENRYRLVTKATNDVIWEWNPKKHELHWSENAQHVFGYSKEEIGPDETWWDVRIHPDDRERVITKLDDLMARNESIWLEEYRFRLRDGSYAYIRDRGYVERDENGDPIRMIGAMSNVTSQKESEIERQAMLEIMQALANTKDLQELLQLVHRAIAKVIYAENFFVVLYQQNSGLFEEIYSVDQYDLPEPPSKLEKSITSYVFRSGEPLLLTQALFDELAKQGEVELVGTNSASWLGVPLKTSGGTIGAVAVQDYENDNRYSERDRDFLSSIAAQIALAIERKQAEEEVRESEERYRLLFENSGEAILITQPNGIIHSANPEACRIFGRTEEEITVVGREGIVDLNDPRLSAALGERKRTGRFKGELNLLRKDGTVFPAEVATTMFRDPRGNERTSMVIRDITERKRAEVAEREQRALAEALRDTAEILSSTLDYGEVLDHILTAVGRVVPHDAGTIMLIEGQAAHVVRSQGYDQQGFKAEVMDIRLPLNTTTNLQQMLETRRPVVVYDTHNYPDWKIMPSTDWLHSNVGAPILIYGEVVGFVCLDSREPSFFTPTHAERLEAFANQAALAIHNARLLQQAQAEILERKQAEQELRASEERFRQLADNIQEAFWMTDAESGEELYLSPAAATIWGRSVESLIDQAYSFTDSVFPEDRPAVRQAFEQEKKGSKVEIEYRIVRPDGSLRWIWDRAFPILDDSGKVKAIAGISADITERREAELALIQSKSRYRELFDNSPTSIWEEDFSLVKKRIDLLRNSGVADLNEYLNSHPSVVDELASLVRITDVNQASLELYHAQQKEDLLGNLKEILTDKTITHFREEILSLLSPRKGFTWEGPDQTLDGRSMEVLVNGSIPHGYEEDWSKVFVTVSDITERKQAERENLRHLAELEALYENGLAVGQLLQPREIGERIIETFARYLSWHHVTIRLREEGSEDLELVAFNLPNLPEQGRVEAAQRFIARISKVSQGLSGWVIQTGMPLRTGNVHAHAQYIGTHAGILSGLYMPLRIGERVIGVISVESEAPDAFTEQDERLLATLANQAAIAFENARLYQSAQQELMERKRVAQELRESQERFQNLFENSPVATWLEDFSEVAIWLDQLRSQGVQNLGEYLAGHLEELNRGVSLIRVLNVNHAAVIMNGAHNKEELIDSIHSLLKEDIPQQVLIHEFEMIWNGSTSFGFEMSSHRLDGSTITGVQHFFIPVNDDIPDYARVIVTSTDITDRVNIENELRASETHYRALADSITDILFEMDQSLRYIHWNKASESLTGIQAENAIGKSMQEIFGESEEQARIQKIYEDVLTTHQPRSFETELFLLKEKRLFEINAYPSTRGVSVVAKDVTDRKRSEVILQKRFELMEFSAHHSLSELMQRAVDEVSELTGSTIGFFHFVEPDQATLGMQTWSTNALGLFHVPLGEGSHLPLDQAGVWAEAVRQRRPLIQNDYEALAEKKGLPSGHVPIVREMVIPIIRNERLMAVMGVGNKPQDYSSHDLEIAARLADYAWDVTERKQMEVALEVERNQLAQRVEERTADLSRANSNLARALRVKDEFLANMSHELRTPLNAILGLSESLGEQIAGPLNEKQQKYVGTIGESGHHLLSLINDILDLAKVEAGQITLDINRVDIRAVCQASLRMIRQLAQKKNQEVLLEIDDGLGLMWADERRLKQMIVNLLGNAVKFTPENGRLGLKVHGDQDSNQVHITVWDKGIGIKADDLERLFQPFVQLDSGLAREASGTGLGLALVAQMARLHGGSVAVVSEPGNGSRFTIVVPWEPALAVDAATRMRTTGKFRAIKFDQANRAKILLVEDTQEVMLMIQDYLEQAGFQVVTAQDGTEAIRQAKLQHPNLILMDVQMPRMNGLEATRKLRSEPDFKYTPIIALTALAMPSDRERCIEAGMDEYLSKPVNLKALVKIIQSCLFSSQEPRQP